MKKYLKTNELVINFKINRLVKKRAVIKAIGGSTSSFDGKIKDLENQLRRN